MSGGSRFGPEQACDLFLETLAAFSAANDKGRALIAAAVTALKGTAKPQFEGKIGTESVSVVLEETNFVIKGEKQRVPVKTAYINVNAEPAEPFGSAVVIRVRQGYQAVVVLGEKKITGAPKLTTEQTREVFLEMLAAKKRE
jgi:hypothetical protein